MSGIGGRAPKVAPARPDTPDYRRHRNWRILGATPARWPHAHRLPSVPAPDPHAWREAAARRELVVKARHVAAALRREQQRQARIAAGVDRSSPNAGPRPRWSR